MAAVAHSAPGDANQAINEAAEELLQGVLPYTASPLKTDYEHYNPLLNNNVVWNGDDSRCFTDCSGFGMALLNHYNGDIDGSFFDAWMYTSRPLAKQFHNAISIGHGFQQIDKVEDLIPGDFIAVEFGKNSGIAEQTGDTGHVMIVAEAPQKITAVAPLQPSGATVDNLYQQWSVLIHDESTSGHGSADTRYNTQENKYYEGLGKGPLRLYTKADGTLAGYAWSPEPTSALSDSPTTFRSQGSPVNAADYNMVFGRFDPAFASTAELTATSTEQATTRYRLTVLDNGEGTAVAYPPNLPFASGTTASIYPTPAAGNIFVGWSGDASGMQTPAKVLMDSEKTVTARFAPAIWSEYDEESGGWLYYSWFGWIYPQGGNSVFHEDLGWVTTSGNDKDDFYIHLPDLGWSWTSEDSYPFIFRQATEDWLYYAGIANNQAVFINNETNETITVTPVK